LGLSISNLDGNFDHAGQLFVNLSNGNHRVILFESYSDRRLTNAWNQRRNNCHHSIVGIGVTEEANALPGAQPLTKVAITLRRDEPGRVNMAKRSTVHLKSFQVL